MRFSDWSSEVFSSDLPRDRRMDCSTSKSHGFPGFSFHQSAATCDEPLNRAFRRVAHPLSFLTMAAIPPPFVPGAFVGAAHHYRTRVYFEDTDLSGTIGRASVRERVCR